MAVWNASTGIYADATNQTGRYIIFNGTVKDTLTEILWEQTASTATMNWTSGFNYCGNRTTGGFNDWRVPNIVELGTSVDYTAGSPYVNTTAFPGAPTSNMWASTPNAAYAGNSSWQVVFSSYGYYGYNGANLAFTVRCVRSCYPIPPPSRYTVNSGEVTDNVTGLIWQQVSTGGTYNQANAFTLCSGLPLNGRAWRLPTGRELATLVDYSINYGTLTMNAAFAGEPADYFWSSSRLAGDQTRAWFVLFSSGQLSYNSVIAPQYVRCVR